jgi:hypothetical protein
MTKENTIQKQLQVQANFFWNALKEVRKGKLSLKVKKDLKGGKND